MWSINVITAVNIMTIDLSNTILPYTLSIIE